MSFVGRPEQQHQRCNGTGMMTLDRDSLHHLVKFLHQPERGTLRQTSRKLDEEIRRRFTLGEVVAVADVIDTKEDPFCAKHHDRWFRWKHFKALGSRFNFQGLRLLKAHAKYYNFDCEDLGAFSGLSDFGGARPSIPMEELRALLDDLPLLRLIFEDVPQFYRQQAIDIAERIDELPAWNACKRWRVGIPFPDQYEYHVHPRVVAAEWDGANGRLRSSPEWLQTLCIRPPFPQHREEGGEYFPAPPIGDYPILRTLSINNPWEEFDNWFAQINAPLLSVVYVASSGQDGLFFFERNHRVYQTQIADCWLMREVLIVDDPHPASQRVVDIIEKRIQEGRT